jgi:hypothetical protein
MRPWRLAAIAVASLVAVLAGSVASSHAEPSAPQACNLRGSWVASTSEASRYMAALNPTSSTIELASGSLTATFTRTTFTFGGLSLHLVGKLGRSTLREVVDIEAEAPYHVRGSHVDLGNGTYKIVYISAKLTRNGRTTTLRLPNSSIATPPSAVPYSCTPRVLHLQVSPGDTGHGVTLALRRTR